VLKSGSTQSRRLTERDLRFSCGGISETHLVARCRARPHGAIREARDFMKKLKPNNEILRRVVLSGPTLESLRPLLELRPNHQEMYVGTGRSMKAICTACGGIDSIIMMDKLKHKKGCELQAQYAALQALRALLEPKK